MTTDPHVSYTDINTSGWIRRMPSAMRPYLLLMRLDRPIGTWLLLLPGWWALLLAPVKVMEENLILYMALFAAGAVIMRGAGCIINDLWDKDFDKQVERTKNRPLAAGTISPRQAILFLIFLLLLGFAILIQFNIYTICLGLLSLIPVCLYPLAKRVTWYPQAALGLTFNFGALMGASAMMNDIPHIYSLALYAAGFFWTMGYDTIYAQQDMGDDALVGIKSTALRFGTEIKAFVGLFYALTTYFLLLALLLADLPLWIVVCAVFCCTHLLWQYKNWNEEDPHSSLKIFKSNRDFGIILCAVIALVFVS